MAETFPFNQSDDEKNSKPSNEASINEETPSYIDQNRYDSDHYTSDEVSEVIRIALQNHKTDSSDAIPYKEIVTIGSDFGLSEEDISEAFDEIAKQGVDKELRSRAELAFKIHALTFIVINTGLVLLNVFTMPSYWWSIFPIIGWGMFLALHGIIMKYMPDLAVTLSTSAQDVAQAHFAQMDKGQALDFKIVTDADWNLMETSGLIQIQDDHLLIEYQSVDSVLGLVKSDVKEVMIDFAEIASVRIEQAFWSTKLCLQGKRLRSFEDVPGHKSGRIRLSFNVRSRAAADKLARHIRKRISEANKTTSES